MKRMKSINKINEEILDKSKRVNLYKGDIVKSIDVLSFLLPDHDYGLITFLEFKIKYISQGQQNRKIVFNIVDPNVKRIIINGNMILDVLEKIILTNERISKKKINLLKNVKVDCYTERENIFKTFSKWKHKGRFSFKKIAELLEYDR